MLTPPTVAVIGGGQLARMMQESAVALGINLRALVEASDGSTGQVTVDKAVGEPADLDAVRALGVPVRRVLLVGGGAKSTAVRALAPQALGAAVEVPEPGEYVALGAAKQAARLR